MIDSHCHLDQYPDPASVAQAAARLGVSIIAMTVLPSHFVVGRGPVSGLARTRLALGLHPLLAEQHGPELALFARLVPETSYIGEVGLDFSRGGRDSRALQLRSFRFILRQIRETPKFISLHSRDAGQAVLELLEEFGIAHAVFHWYTGPAALASTIAERGYYFSVNPAMLRSEKGRNLVRSMRRDRVLTESDGPYVRMGDRAILPQDVLEVSQELSTLWQSPEPTVQQQLKRNFTAATAHLPRAGPGLSLSVRDGS